jgi:hypothetical protein
MEIAYSEARTSTVDIMLNEYIILSFAFVVHQAKLVEMVWQES